MLIEIQKEKKDVEHFITDILKNLSDDNKQRVADILVGMQLAVPAKTDKPNYPQGVPAQCG